MRYITHDAYMMGRDKEYPTTEQMEIDTSTLLFRVNGLLSEFLKDNPTFNVEVSSGYRPGKYNVAAGGAPQSGHLICRAVDIKDMANILDAWITAQTDAVLVRYGLWREHPDRTRGWSHLDITHRSAFVRTFLP